MIRNFITKVKKEIGTMNSDFEAMSYKNKSKSAEIRNSIKKKSEDFNQLKEKRSKHFNSIRNK
jgi:hypothetical protein